MTKPSNKKSGRLSKGKTLAQSSIKKSNSGLSSREKSVSGRHKLRPKFEPRSQSTARNHRIEALAEESKVAKRGSKKRTSGGFEKSGSATHHTTKGLSLGAKLSVTIALVSVVITISVGATIASRTSSYINDEILKYGIDGVKLLAAYGKGLIKAKYEGDEMRIGQLTNKIKTMIDYSDLSYVTRNSFPNNESLKSPITDGYVNLIHNEQEQKLFSIMPDASDKVKTRSKTTLINGPIIMESKDQSKLVVRKIKLSKTMGNVVKEYDLYQFSMDIIIEELDLPEIGKNGNQYRPDKGIARLFLDTQKVSDAENSVYELTAVILAASIIISILIAYLLSKSITRPILQLVKDMTAVSQGDLDHRTIAHSTDEVGYLSMTFNNLTHSLKAAQQTEIEKEKLEHDLSVGREIQQTLLPKTLYKIPNYDLDAFYMSAKEVGGDYYDLIPVDKTKLGVIVADVSGKGIQGAMIMTIMRTVMNIAAVGNLSCKNCLGRTNRFLSDRIKRGMFVTAFYAILDCKKDVIKFSSAGHNPMIVYRAANKEIELLNPTGIALGFDKGPLFDRTLKEGETVLNPGDRFVLYTDGVVESMNEKHEEFTDPRFHNFVKQHADLDSKTFVHKLVAELKKHQGSAPQHDDITIVTFRKT